ncbi:MAG: Calx-beta domain-containing protein, partial [Verrucomicrobiota bacterium]
TATAGIDFRDSTEIVAFSPSENLKLVSLPILNDGLKETQEQFRISLSDPVGTFLGPRTAAIVSITDNDPGIHFTRSRLWGYEDQQGIDLTVHRGNDQDLRPFTVNISFIDETAKASEDYLGSSQVIQFVSGEMMKSIWIPVFRDDAAEADETFQVQLSNPSENMSLGANSKVSIKILDAAGVAPRRFESIRRVPEGIEIEVVGSLSSRFRSYYSIFQIERSEDFKSWNWLPLVSHKNTSSAFAMITDSLRGSGFYRLIEAPLFAAGPPPTGPYAVGVTRRFIVDPKRRNRYRISTAATFPISIWYPAQPIAGRFPEPHYEPELIYDSGFEESWMDKALRVRAYATGDLPVLPKTGGWPVALYSHGASAWRVDAQYLALNLASHGFIVVAPDHHDAWPVPFPDGTVFTLAGNLSINVVTSQDRVQDLILTLNCLSELESQDDLLRSQLNLERVASLGFSWGALSAADFCRLDDRCDVTVSLDWGTGTEQGHPELMQLGVQKPALMLNAEGNSSQLLYLKATRDAYWVQISNTVHRDFALATWAAGNTEASLEGARTIQSYVLSFINKFLQGADDHLLDDRASEFPRVKEFKKK